MLEGYEYLEGISALIPNSFQVTAEAHKKSLLDSVYLGESLSETFKNDRINQLEIIKNELQTISRERVQIEVFSRQTISEAKKLKFEQKQKEMHLRYLSRTRNINVNNDNNNNQIYKVVPTTIPYSNNDINQPIKLPQYYPPDHVSRQKKENNKNKIISNSIYHNRMVLLLLLFFYDNYIFILAILWQLFVLILFIRSI